jgi:phosphate-selective porin OprO and OprP
MKLPTTVTARSMKSAIVATSLVAIASSRAAWAQVPPADAAPPESAGAAVEEPPPVTLPPPGEAAPAAKPHARERSPLAPDFDARRQEKRPVEPTLTFAPGRGLSFVSADGDFELNLKVRGQVLATFEKAHTGERETLMGTQIRRARVAFQGHMFGAHNKYKMELAVSPRDASSRVGSVGTAPLLDWYMTFDYLKEATVVVGQYKVPFSRQRVVSSGSMQMVDRSIVQSEFNLDRNVGLDIRSTSLLGGRVHYNAGVYGGEGRNAFEVHDSNVVLLGRAEVLPFGKFDDYVEGDFDRTGPRASLAGSFAHLSNSLRNQGPLGKAPADAGTTTFDTAEADVLLKLYGLSVTGEFFWRRGARKQGPAVGSAGAPVPLEKPRDGTGWFAQAGYLLPYTMLEIEGRYGELHRSGDGSSLSDRKELGGGVSYYFARHTVKLQADYFRLWAADKLSEGTDQIRVQLETGL